MIIETVFEILGGLVVGGGLVERVWPVSVCLPLVNHQLKRTTPKIIASTAAVPPNNAVLQDTH